MTGAEALEGQSAPLRRTERTAEGYLWEGAAHTTGVWVDGCDTDIVWLPVCCTVKPVRVPHDHLQHKPRNGQRRA